MQKPYSDRDKLLLEKMGKRIKELRMSIGLSQEKLAFASELDRSYVGSVERGERNIAFINLSKICKALHVSLSEFFNFDHE